MAVFVSGDCFLLRRFDVLPRRRLHWRQPQQGDWAIVGGDPVAPLDAAPVAAMDHHLLAIHAEGNADGRHQRPAGTEPVTRTLQIDVPRGEAQRAMIAVPATEDNRSDKSAAAAAFERIALVGAGPRAKRRVVRGAAWLARAGTMR